MDMPGNSSMGQILGLEALPQALGPEAPGDFGSQDPGGASLRKSREALGDSRSLGGRWEASERVILVGGVRGPWGRPGEPWGGNPGQSRVCSG